MARVLLLCDKTRGKAEASQRPRKKLTKSRPIYPKHQPVSSAQNRDMSDSPEPVTTTSDTLIKPFSPPTTQHVSDASKMTISSPPAQVTKDRSSSPAVSLMKTLPPLANKRPVARMRRHSLLAEHRRSTQPGSFSAKMDGRSQYRSPAHPSPLQRIFSRKHMGNSSRQTTSGSQSNLHNISGNTRAFAYENAVEGPQPVYVESLQMPPPRSFNVSPSDSNAIPRSHSMRHPASGSGGSSPQSSRSSRVGLQGGSPTDGTSRSSRSSRLLDTKSWTYKWKPNANTKDRMKLIHSPSSSLQPPQPVEPLPLRVNMSGMQIVREQNFNSSPSANTPNSEALLPPFASDATSIYSQDSDGQRVSAIMDLNSSSLDERTSGTHEDIERRIKEHRRLAYYCINGGVRQSKPGGGLDTPGYIFKDRKGKGKERESVEPDFDLPTETPLRGQRQLSKVSEHESETDMDNLSFATEKRRRRKLTEIPPPEHEAFNEFIRSSAQKTEESETTTRSRVEVTADGQVIDRGDTPPPLPPRNRHRCFVKAEQGNQENRPIRTSPLQGQIWWERQYNSLPAAANQTSESQERAKSLPHEAASSRLQYVAPTPLSLALPHFRTIEEAEAYRRSQSSGISSSQIQASAQEGDDITALPRIATSEEIAYVVPGPSEVKKVVKHISTPDDEQDNHNSSQWPMNTKAPGLPNIPETYRDRQDPSPQPTSSNSAPSSSAPSAAEEKVKLRPSPLNFTSHRTTPSTNTPNTISTTAPSSSSNPWTPKSPFFDVNGRLISPSERQKRFAEIRAAAVEEYEKSSPPLPRKSFAQEQAQESSPASSNQTWPTSASSSGRKKTDTSTPPSSPPVPLTPSYGNGYELFACANPYEQKDRDDDDDDDGESSSEGEIVELYLHRDASVDIPDISKGKGKGREIIGAGKAFVDGAGAIVTQHYQLQRLELNKSKTSTDNAEIEDERQEWENDARKRVDRIRMALQTKSVYGGRSVYGGEGEERWRG